MPLDGDSKVFFELFCFYVCSEFWGFVCLVAHEKMFNSRGQMKHSNIDTLIDPCTRIGADSLSLPMKSKAKPIVSLSFPCDLHVLNCLTNYET